MAFPIDPDYKVGQDQYRVSYPLGYNTSIKGTKKRGDEIGSNIMEYIPLVSLFGGANRINGVNGYLKSRRFKTSEYKQSRKAIKKRLKAHKARGIISMFGLGIVFLIPDIVVSVKNAIKKKKLNMKKIAKS